MITFYGGKPRAGKTLVVVLELLRVLRDTRLPVVTNLALELHPWVDGRGVARRGLLRVLEDEYGQRFDAERRILLLKPEQVRRFYAVRPRVPSAEWEPTVVETIPKESDSLLRFDGNKHGACVYFIDEAHEYFPGAAVGAGKDAFDARELLSWGSQQARIGDQAHFISQVLMNVDKKLRGVSQECWLMTNHRHLAIGPFRQPDVITYSVYSSTPPGNSEAWLKWGRMKFSREVVYSVYNTSSGVGVSGNTKADIGQRARGLHWSWIFAVGLGFSLAGLAVFHGFKYSAGAVTRSLLNSPAPAVASVAAAVPSPVVSNVPSVRLLSSEPVPVVKPERRRVSEVAGGRFQETNAVVVGISQGSAGWSVAWSDGQVTRAGEVREAGRDVFVDGILCRRGVVKPSTR